MSARARVLATVFVLSLTVLLLQVVLSRVFTGLVYNELYFFPLSIAMLGLCGGGVLLYAFEDRFSAEPEALARRSIHRAFFASLAFAGLCVALNGLSRKTLDVRLEAAARGDYESLFFHSRILLVCLYGSVSVLPFYFLGLAISALLKGYAQIVNTVYFWDLAGATVGAVLALPVLNTFASVNYLLVAPILAALALAIWERRGLVYLAGLATVFVLIQLTNAPTLEATTLRALRYMPEYEVTATDWSATSYMQIMEHRNGRSWILLQDHQSRVGGPRYQAGSHGCFHRSERPCRAARWIALASLLRGRPDSVCLLAAGVGRQILEADHFGVEEIVGVEMNPALLPFAEREVPEARLPELMSEPHVRYVLDEGRHFLRNTNRRFDLILIPPFGSARVTSAPSSPNHILTEESIVEYLERLDDGGLLVVTQDVPWTRGAEARLARLVSMVLNGLQRAGIEQPDRYALAFDPGFVFVSNRPFLPEELQRTEPLARRLKLEPRWMRDVGAALDPPSRRVTDDYPFFQGASSFAQLWRDLTWPLRPGGEVTGGSVAAVASLVALVLVLVVIVLPLVASPRVRAGVSRGDWLAIGYFFCLGAGFMFIEIPLMEKLVFALGHPIYSISFCLAVLLASTGLGSLASGRLLWGAAGLRRGHLIVAFGVLIVLQAALYAGIQPLLAATRELPTPVQISLIGLSIVPLGLLLGVPFPQGIALLRDRGRTSLIPWAWGVNGAASVLAINLSLMLVRILGVTPMFLLALGFYVVAFLLLGRSLLAAR